MGILVNCVTLVKYVFVFWLKNPAGLDQDFWCTFINLWISTFHFLLYLAVGFVRQKTSVNSFVCSGLTHGITSLSDKNEQGTREVKVIVRMAVSISLIIHIYVHLRIYFYKRKHNRSEANTDSQCFAVDMPSLASTTINFCVILTLTFCGWCVYKIDQLGPLNITYYPNHLLLYAAYLINPNITILTFTVLHYSRHEHLRKVLTRELHEVLLKFKESR